MADQDVDQFGAHVAWLAAFFGHVLTLLGNLDILEVSNNFSPYSLNRPKD
jgi:hypothetical protein